MVEKVAAVGFSIVRTVLLGTTALTLFGTSGAAARVGVTSATEGDPLGKPPAENERVLRIGIDVQANEVITTNAKDRAHLVFLDGTSLTVGPNAQLTIDRFVFDPATKTGDLAITASKGVFRLVGGKISKTKPIAIVTPSGTIGIRGGITIFTATAVRTTSTFVFGNSMTVSGMGQTQTVTRPGSQVTANFGSPPGPPTLVGQGALSGAMNQLEGSSSSGGSGGSQGSGNPSPGAQNLSNQNSALGPGGINPPPSNPLPAIPNSNNPPQNAVNPGVNDPPQQAAAPSNNTAPPAPTPTVIVTQGRYLADPIFNPDQFNRKTLAVPHNPQNDQALAPTGTVLGGRATITTSDGRVLNVPWIPGRSFDFSGSAPSGAVNAQGFVSLNGDFFAYVFTDSHGGKFGAVGGTPTPTSGIPTAGIGKHVVVNISGSGDLPFASERVASDPQLKAAASLSNMYTAYSQRLGPGVLPGVPDGQASVSLQTTVSIAGQGAGQKSYMGVFIGSNFIDTNSDTVANAGQYTGSYRMAARQGAGRLVSNETTAATAQGNAIYGPSDNFMFYVPDKLSTTVDRGVATTTRTPGASLDQPMPNQGGTPYFQGAVAIKDNSLDPALGQARTTQTMNGYVGGIVESSNPRRGESHNYGSGESNNHGRVTHRLLNVGASNPGDVSITTNAETNRAQATIIVQNFGGRSGFGAPTTTFELGSASGPGSSRKPNEASSAFINNGIYGMRDQTNDRERHSHVTIGDWFNVRIKSDTVLASYNSAPLPNNQLPGGVTPCECSFMTWGWWSGTVSYDRHGFHRGPTDSLNLATYVAGTLTNVVQLPNTGSATYSGHAVGNVVNHGKSYVAAGTFTQNWNFASQTGNVTIGNFDGRTYTGTTALQSGTVNFRGPLSAPGRTGSLNGSFFSNGAANPVAGQAGNFSVTGANYKAGGTFVGKKQ